MVDKCAIIIQAVEDAYKDAPYPPYTALELNTILQDCPAVKDVIATPGNNGVVLPPVAEDDSATTPEGVAVKIFVLANDFDKYGNGNTALTIAAFTQASGGAVTLNSDRTLTYTPSSNFFGPDSFTYFDLDGKGSRSNDATVSVSVTSDRPRAINDLASTDKGTTSAPINVLANDISSNPPLQVTLRSTNSAKGGTMSVNPDNTVTYNPPASFSGQDTFLYFDTDANSKTSNDATVTVTVTNVAPTAVNDDDSTTENVPVAVPVLSNDKAVAPKTDTLTPQVATQPAHGKAAVNGDNTIEYTPNSGFTGTDTFTYHDIDQRNRLSNDATVTVTVTNSAPTIPTANPDGKDTDQNTPTDINVLANDKRINPTDAATVQIQSQPKNGTASVNSADQTVHYIPDNGFFGVNSFSYSFTEASISTPSNNAVVTVTVAHKIPTALDDTDSTTQNIPVPVPVLSNDSPADLGDILTVAVQIPPTNGIATVSPDKTIKYTPIHNFIGTDTFTYHDTDQKGRVSRNALVTVTVTSTAPSVPIANPDTATTDENEFVDIVVLSNDKKATPVVPSHTLTVQQPSKPPHGTASVNADQTVKYTPDDGFFGTDTFTYNDLETAITTPSNTATVTVTVARAAPTAVNDTDSTTQNKTVNVPVLSNDIKVKPLVDVLTVHLRAQAKNGEAVVNANNNTISYTPNGNFAGTDTFTYFDTDQNRRTSNDATVTITVSNAGPTVPVAVDDDAVTPENTAKLIPVLDNDVRTDQHHFLSVTISTAPGHGNAIVNGNNTVTYTPAPGFFGQDTFKYFDTEQTITTPSNIALVTVNVTHVLLPPVAVNDTAVANQDSSIPISVLNNDNDPEDSTKLSLSIQIQANPKNGTVKVNPGSSTTLATVTYTPSPSFAGTDIFSYLDLDTKTGLSSNIANVTVAVQIKPPPPVVPPVVPPPGLKGNPYVCGRPGAVMNITNSDGGKIGAASWDFEASITEVYGTVTSYNTIGSPALADKALIQFRWVKFLSENQSTCTTAGGCTAPTVCGTAFSPALNNVITGVCGPQLGYWSANQLCSRIKTSRPDDELLKCSLIDIYACDNLAKNSCYSNGAKDNCCGCANWGEAPYNLPVGTGVNKDGAPFTVQCKYPPSNVFKPPAGSNSEKWIDNVLIADLWMKKACPSCYTFQYDDASSTFTCSSDYSGGTNKANYLVIACPSTATNDPPAKAAWPKPIDNTRGITFYNNCPFPIWPAMTGGSAAQSKIPSQGNKCNSDKDCFPGSSCFSESATSTICFWDNPQPVKPGTQTPTNNFKADPGQQIEFRLPMSADNFGTIWNGALGVRTGCDETGKALCDVLDCRAAPSTDFSCTPPKGLGTPGTRTEPAFAYTAADFFDVTLIDGIHVAMEMISDVNIEQII